MAPPASPSSSSGTARPPPTGGTARPARPAPAAPWSGSGPRPRPRPPSPSRRCCAWCGAGRSRPTCGTPGPRPRGTALPPPACRRPPSPGRGAPAPAGPKPRPALPRPGERPRSPSAPSTALKTGDVETYKRTLNGKRTAPARLPPWRPGGGEGGRRPRGRLLLGSGLLRGDGDTASSHPTLSVLHSAARRPRSRAGTRLESPLLASSSAGDQHIKKKKTNPKTTTVVLHQDWCWAQRHQTLPGQAWLRHLGLLRLRLQFHAVELCAFFPSFKAYVLK